VARTTHFALHRVALDADKANAGAIDKSIAPSLALFTVQSVWLGAMVPKRWAKRAVTRNTIKRQIYAVSADFESAMPVAAHVVRLRAGFDRAHFLSATSEVLKAAVRLELQQLFARVAVRQATSFAPASPA
jgi:ribonuclease P protein component